VGQLSLVPIFAVVSELYGWRVGFVCVSVATALLVVPSYLLLREDEQRQAQRQAQRQRTEGEGKGEDEVECTSVWARLSILHYTPAYWVILAVFVICGISTTGFIETHLVALVVDRGESVRTGASAFSVLSAANGLAMVGAGYLTDVMDRYVLLGIIFSLRMIAYGLLLTFQSSPMLYVFAILFGLADYSVVPPVCSLVKTLAVQHGVDFTGLGVGILLCWHSIGAAVGAWVGGHVFATDGSYQAALFICGSLCLVAALALFAMPVLVGGGRRLMDERGEEVAAQPFSPALDKPEALELASMPVKV
jgi:predicted MFS family arabinose efflux permease